METTLRIKNLNFTYKNSKTSVIKDFSLDIQKGSFTTFLGPSGCGKTTLLKLILGFLTPDSGRIFLNGIDVSSVPVEKRKIAVVFQDYALFPHMNVQQNILFGLKAQKREKKLTKEQQNALLQKICETLNLTEYIKNYPSELSGGQQQRVALGRALILEPEILLLDEPLSSLDAKLRISLRSELREIQQRLGITTINVTHDQEEALSLSDQIAVINKGHLEQYGTCEDVYFSPENEFTALFVGNGNFITLSGKKYLVRPEWCILQLEGKSVLEDVQPATGGENANEVLIGTILSVTFLGNRIRCLVQSDAGIFNADVNSVFAKDYKIGTKVIISFLYKKALSGLK